MSDARVQLLLAQMDAGFGGNGWVTAARQSLDGLTSDQAARRPATGIHSIWELVNHLTFWKELVAARLRGAPMTGERIRNPETFGAAAPGDEEAWATAVQRLMQAQASLREALANVREEDLDRSLAGEQTPVLELISGMILHDPYHLGQMALLRKLVQE